MASLYVTACSSPYKKLALLPTPDPKISEDGLEEMWKKISPIQRNLSEPAARAYSGDDFTVPHGILWDKEAYFKQKNLQWPTETEKIPLVVIGAGMSGLCSAYLLREHNPIVLEQARTLGGNSKGESWKDVDYSIGAAYFMKPEKDSGLEKLIKELGIDQIARVKSDEDPVILNHKFIKNFWTGETAPEAKKQFEKIAEHFRNVCNGKKGWIFPDYPTEDQSHLKKIKSLDQISFKKHLQKIAGAPLHPHINANLEHFCWSSYGAGFDEISAAAGLNFYASEFGGDEIMVTPGGNAAITEALAKKLYQKNPNSLRTSCLVFDVKVKDDKVFVHYLNPQGEVKAIEAQTAIMSCPKFVVKKILNDIEPSRLEAINKLQYNAYLVANVCLDKNVPDQFYDLFMLRDASCDSKNLMSASSKDKVTDVVHGCYAKPNANRSVMTLYRALPFVGGRPMVYNEGSYSQYRQEFEDQIHTEILPLLNLKKENIQELRITRWGHPLPVAKPGFISEGTAQILRKPYKDKVFFVEQDNWGLPAFETAAGEALLMADKIKKRF